MRKRSVETREKYREEMLYGDLVGIYRLKKRLNAELLKYFDIKTFY